MAGTHDNMNTEVPRSLPSDLHEVIFRANPLACVISVYSDGRIVDANDAFLRFFGYDLAEIIGRTSTELGLYVNVGDREALQHELLRERSVSFRPVTVHTKSNELRRVFLHANLIDVNATVHILSSFLEEPGGADGDGTPDTVLHFLHEAGASQKHKSTEHALQESEERMRWSLQGAGGGAWDFDLVTGTAWWSKEMYELWGISPDNVMFLENSLAIVHGDDRERVRRQVAEAIERHVDYKCEFRIRHAERGERWMTSLGRPILDGSGRTVRLLGISLDITDRKLAEEALRGSEERLRIFIEHAPASIAMFDRDMHYVAVSNRWMTDYHLGDRSVIGRSHYEIFPEITDRWKAVHKAGMTGDVVQAAEDRFDRADGSFQWLRWEVRPWHLGDDAVGGIIIMSEDITERKLAENTLIASLREKEVMLKEIHHRVKNNLQVVSSLLSMQANCMQDPMSRQALLDSRNRVRSMSLVHERLYRSRNLASIDFSAFLQDVTGDLHRSYHVPGVRVLCNVDPLEMEVNIAIPCGLIVNELVSNALKHGFPEGREGTVSVILGRKGERHVSLTVDDDGIGFPAGTEFRTMQTMGMTLVQALVAQIEGEISLRAQPGAHFTITFPL